MTAISGNYDIDPEDYKLDTVPGTFAYLIEIAVQVEVRGDGTDDPDQLKDQIDRSTLYLHSPDFLTLLAEVECEFDFQDLFLNPDEMPDILAKRGTHGYNNKVAYENKLSSNEEAEICGLVALLVYYFRNNRTEDLKQEFEANYERFDDKRDGYLLDLFRSHIGTNITADRSYGELSEPIKYANNACRSGPEHPILKLNLAESIIRACELRFDYEPNISGLPQTRTEILEHAVEQATEAKQRNPEFSRVHTTLARGNALLHNFDSAWSNLNEAILNEDPSNSDAHLTEAKLEQLQQNINARYQTHSIEEEVESAKGNLRSIKQEFDSLESELDSTLDKYRKNNLSFIGFFAALITLVVASVEIINGTESTIRESGRLIIMLSGGMLVAFGGFGLILPKTSENPEAGLSQDARTIAIAVIGALLIGIGYPGFLSGIVSALLP
ncbi:hypothetical protein ACOZ4I_14285 [Haloarcula salina]|uniref:hypothetical protein n=1 Tax=Haloarcula salina TaxID=1429914 RepID=UPI003C702DAB